MQAFLSSSVSCQRQQFRRSYGLTCWTACPRVTVRDRVSPGLMGVTRDGRDARPSRLGNDCVSMAWRNPQKCLTVWPWRPIVRWPCRSASEQGQPGRAVGVAGVLLGFVRRPEGPQVALPSTSGWARSPRQGPLDRKSTRHSRDDTFPVEGTRTSDPFLAKVVVAVLRS